MPSLNGMEKLQLNLYKVFINTSKYWRIPIVCGIMVKSTSQSSPGLVPRSGIPLRTGGSPVSGSFLAQMSHFLTIFLTVLWRLGPTVYFWIHRRVTSHPSGVLWWIQLIAFSTRCCGIRIIPCSCYFQLALASASNVSKTPFFSSSKVFSGILGLIFS